MDKPLLDVQHLHSVFALPPPRIGFLREAEHFERLGDLGG